MWAQNSVQAVHPVNPHQPGQASMMCLATPSLFVDSSRKGLASPSLEQCSAFDYSSAFDG